MSGEIQGWIISNDAPEKTILTERGRVDQFKLKFRVIKNS